MTTGPENPYGEQDSGTPPTHQPYGAPPPPAPTYGTPPPYSSPPPYQQPQYQQPQYQQTQYQQPQYQPSGYPPHPNAVGPRTDGLALGSMITGITALVIGFVTCGIGLLACPVALVLGIVSLLRIKRSQGQLGGTAMAVTGVVLGALGTLLLIAGIATLVVAGVQEPSSFST